MKIRPFSIEISDAALADLQRRLSNTRWAGATAGTEREDGFPSDTLKGIVSYWQDSFDWRREEARLNRLAQFTATVDGLDIHFVHERGNGPSPLPLIISHGWPGSFAEFSKIIPMLADPGSHGGSPSDAFDVVAPSLPGYGFSQRPPQGTGPDEIAGLWQQLMLALGYPRFGAQGGDWGASVASWLGYRFPENVLGFHLNFIPGSYRPPLGTEDEISHEEKEYLSQLAGWLDAEGAYGHIQRTKPRSLAYGLNDSPAGLAAWILEKFQAWSDCDGRLDQTFTLDEMLTNISIYWFTETIGSSMQLYRESARRPLRFARGERIPAPMGVAIFPFEVFMPPRSWVERVYDVRRWREMPRGGHFAALEQPGLLAQEIREFFRPLR